MSIKQEIANFKKGVHEIKRKVKETQRKRELNELDNLKKKRIEKEARASRVKDIMAEKKRIKKAEKVINKGKNKGRPLMKSVEWLVKDTDSKIKKKKGRKSKPQKPLMEEFNELMGLE